MDEMRRRAGELAHQAGEAPTLAGILQGRGAGRFAEPRLLPTKYAPGERESTNIEDRRFPIRTEFGPLSLQQLLEQYNGLIERPTDMNMERAQDLLWELERRGHVRLAPNLRRPNSVPYMPAGPPDTGPGPRNPGLLGEPR